jgi:hypothetical protein
VESEDLLYINDYSLLKAFDLLSKEGCRDNHDAKPEGDELRFTWSTKLQKPEVMLAEDLKCDAKSNRPLTANKACADSA